MASPRVSAPRWDSDGVLIGGARWKPVSGVRLQRYGFEFDALVRGEAHERAEKRVPLSTLIALILRDLARGTARRV